MVSYTIFQREYIKTSVWIDKSLHSFSPYMIDETECSLVNRCLIYNATS